MVQDPLSILDALMVALSGFIIVFIMLAVLWGVIVVISRAVTGVENRTDAAVGGDQRYRSGLRYGHRQPRDRYSA